jgi:hypothetical protein
MEAPKDLLPCCHMFWPNDCHLCNMHNINMAPGPSAPPAVTAVPMDANSSGDDLAEIHSAFGVDNDEAPPILLQALTDEEIDKVLAFYEQFSEDEDCCDGAKKAKLSEADEGASAVEAEPNKTEVGECSPSDNVEVRAPFALNEFREAEGPSVSATVVPAPLPTPSPAAPPAAVAATAPKTARKRQARKPAAKREKPEPTPQKTPIKKEVSEEPTPAKPASKKKELSEEELKMKRERQKMYSQKNRIKVITERRTNKEIIEDKDKEIQGLKEQLEKLTLENTSLKATLETVNGENVKLREVLFAPVKS